jgi:hypothetical protein
MVPVVNYECKYLYSTGHVKQFCVRQKYECSFSKF